MIFTTTVTLAAIIVLFVLGINLVMSSLLAPVYSNRAQSMSKFHASLSGAQSPGYEHYS